MSCEGRRGQIWAVPTTSLLLGGRYTARTRGPWERSGGDLGPQHHPLVSVRPQHCSPSPSHLWCSLGHAGALRSGRGASTASDLLP